MANDNPLPGARPPSLGEVHGSVAVSTQLSFWRRLFAFSGPAYLVSVGYMDPGNWATDIAAGSKFGYALHLGPADVEPDGDPAAEPLGAARDRDRHGPRAGVPGDVRPARLAACCGSSPRSPSPPATSPRCSARRSACSCCSGSRSSSGVVITAFDTLLLLVLQSRGVRMMEAFIVVLIATIGGCLAIEIVLSKPAWGSIAGGLVPSLPGDGALYLAIGILGATVMPHNLYLHSALVQSRRITQTPGRNPQRGQVQHHRLGGGAQRRLLRQRRAPRHGGGDVLPGGAPRRGRDPGRPPPPATDPGRHDRARSPSRWR